MNRVTSTEANVHFAEVTRMVDRDGIVIITKKGKERYVMMRYEDYTEEMARNVVEGLNEGLWVRESPSSVTKIQTDGDTASITTLHLSEDGLIEGYNLEMFPRESLKIRKHEGSLSIENTGLEKQVYGGVLEKLLEDPSEKAEELLGKLEPVIKEMQDIDQNDLYNAEIRR